MGKGRRNVARLEAVRVAQVPLREVSGLCLRRGAEGAMTLVAIGDRVAVAAWVVLPADDRDDLVWETIELTKITGTRLSERDPQIEAVCADGAGRVLLLQESPPRTELIDPVGRRVVASIDLQIHEPHPLARAWADSEGSRGEGAVLLRNGHLLIAKEKDPRALIEFGPAGEEPSGFSVDAPLEAGAGWQVQEGEQAFVPLATWMPDQTLAHACRDFSDLEVGPDDRLYLLSDRSASMVRLADLVVGSADATAEQEWSLGDLEGKPEGLAFTRNGRAIVALDTRKAKHNIVLFEPPIAV